MPTWPSLYKGKTYRDEFFARISTVLADAVQPGEESVVVEIGTRYGFWARQLLEYRPVNRVFCIDPWPRRSRRGIYDVYPVWQDTLRPWAFRSAFPLRGTSQEWGKVWSHDYRPHVVFVDGDHRAAPVKADAEIWWPLVRAGGAIFFHDYNESAVKDVVDEFFSNCRFPVDVHSWGPREVLTAEVRKDV